MDTTVNAGVPQSVAACETQPITAEGLKSLLASCPDLEFVGAADSLASGLDVVRRAHPALLVLDKAFGVQAILDWIQDLKISDLHSAVVVWGVSVTEAEALRLLQAGAKGIVRKSADLRTVLACLRSVSAGTSWMDDCLFREAGRSDRYPRSDLTPREQQVLELIEQGFKNKDIARELGIRPGTVKIHLKHIFEKTGVRGRYGLALTGMKERGLVSLPEC